jgi:flagellar biosynthesis GTPase FlhF
MPRATKPVKKEKEPQKRRSRPDHFSDDDESVDSRGNIRGLIAYSDEEDYTDESEKKQKPNRRGAKKASAGRKNKRHETSSEEEEVAVRPKRQAALKAEKVIRSVAEESKPRSKAKAKKVATPSPPARKPVVTSSSEDYDDEETEESFDVSEEEEVDEYSSEVEGETDEEESETEGEEDEFEDEEDNYPRRGGGIELVISDLGEQLKPQKPKKYKLSKEPENVRRFVKLVQGTDEPTENDIDRDIGYFKGLSPKAQDTLLTKLQQKVHPAEPTVPLKFQIMAKEVPAEIERVALAKYNALQNIDPSTTEYYKVNQWINGYTQLPLGVYKDLPVKLEDGNEACQKFVSTVRENMDSAIYGHDEAKLQILQFVSSWIANPQAAGNVLSIHGPPGVGKTTLIKDGVAKALGRPFHFITLGGATDASFLDGHSYTYEGSTWGRIVDVLIKSKCMNPVIYFDELDKVSETPKGEEINNLLIHLTDGSQNDRFQDKYFTGIDLDLSRCLFIFSHNNHEKVNPILRDRMYNIQVDGFDLKQKQIIADQYLVNAALREVNLFEKIAFSKDIVGYIIENFTGEEKGVRELKRCIQTVISKLNLLRFYNDPARVPFAIKEFALPFTLRREHIDLFLKKKPAVDDSISHLYT